MGGRKVKVTRPRVRTVDGKKIRLEAYEWFRNDGILARYALAKALHGLSTRNYAFALEGIGNGVEEAGVSKSTISWRSARMTKDALNKLLISPLDDLDIAVVYIGGMVVVRQKVVCAWRGHRW
ncbi:MAG TPA: hypothetical protein GX506_11900 [Firmicutes bacterium]|nr:hypothetical protein [Bacillota bacterium]